MAYEYKALRRQRVRYNDDNDDNPLVYQLVIDDKKVTPSSATVTIYKPGSTTAIVSADSMTVSGTLLTYAVDTTTTADFPEGEGFQADLAVTYSGTIYRHRIVFDVVKYILKLQLARDQILDRDDGLLGGEHAGDEELQGLITAARDEMQVMLEAKAFADKMVVENMVLDTSKLSICARLYVLEMFWRNKDNEDKADYYERRFDKMWSAFTHSVKYDKNLDGEEDSNADKIIHQRFVL